MTLALANRQRRVALDRKALRALCERILAAHGLDANVSLCYVGDAAIRALNQRYLGLDEATDVLAFPLEEQGEMAGSAPEERLLGEIVVSAEKALAEATRRRIPVARELALYTAHGLLHLLGYDDHTPADRRRMRRAERAALAAAGLP
ncbi:MAG TPA: rRNA maturation RNase YbeY [Planctomycetota bacterium]|nr:rRNA maturation RNase YbeY [Planctomycetota bacterium]